MRGPEHVSIAVGSTVLAISALGGGEAEIGIYASAATAAAIGALVPDIDHPKSLIGSGIPARIFGLGFGALIAVAALDWQSSRSSSPVIFEGVIEPLRPLLPWAWLAVGVAVALLLISLVVSAMLPHRGPTHSLVVGAVLTLIVTSIVAFTGPSWTVGLWFGWGYLSHLLTDWPSKMGCPFLLWPWLRGDAHLPL
ncbi:MAG: hypothetical protein Kow0056_08390 [Coriobacteriia bacterium]